MKMRISELKKFRKLKNFCLMYFYNFDIENKYLFVIIFIDKVTQKC